VEDGDPPPIVFTQLPRSPDMEQGGARAGGTLRRDTCEGARIVLLEPGSRPRVLTEGFHGACDPDVSFDGRRMLFAGKREAADTWNVFEAELDGTAVRQVTHDAGNCRRPLYVGSIYTIVDEAPSEQIVFVSDRSGEQNEFGPLRSTSLYSCRTDGSRLRRLTFNPSSDLDPAVLPDGRLVFSSWQRRGLERGFEGRLALFAAQNDGLDYAIFSGDEGRRVKHMVVFVEGDRLDWDGAGNLAAVSLRRNLHSYRRLTEDADGRYHSPAPLPDGRILVSRRPADGSASHGIYRLDVASGTVDALFDDPEFHDVQARAVAARPRPDGRSSVVSDTYATGVLYGLNVYESDLRGRGWVAPGTPLRLRVLEGLPRKADDDGLSLPSAARGAAEGYHTVGQPPLLPRRVLGEVAVAADGSFNIEVPAEVPIELQLLGGDGVALRSCGWIWVRRRETRGCIGCHEDGELTPRNAFAEALARPSVPLTLPPDRRRTVDFERDVRPIVVDRCAAAGCHVAGGATPLLDGPAGSIATDAAYAGLLAGAWIDGAPARTSGTWVHPGRARTSPLAWHLVGRNTSRPWDETASGGKPAPMPPAALTEDERLTLLEWIDLGAPWSGRSHAETTGGAGTSRAGGDK
jgi:hypothetical protein